MTKGLNNIIFFMECSFKISQFYGITLVFVFIRACGYTECIYKKQLDTVTINKVTKNIQNVNTFRMVS